MSDADIQENLEGVEDSLESIDFRGVTGVVRKMEDRLAKDKDSDRRQGLYRSRRLFIVSCFAARHRYSTELARELLRFLQRNAGDIEDEEKNHLLREWCEEGASHRRGLVDGDDLDKVLRILGGPGSRGIEGWQSLKDRVFLDHERGQHRFERYDFGLSAPGRRSTLTNLSYISRTAYHSPMRSQLHDETDAIRVHQHLILHGIDNLHRQFDGLGHRD
jgi:hypothetical protein